MLISFDNVGDISFQKRDASAESLTLEERKLDLLSAGDETSATHVWSAMRPRGLFNREDGGPTTPILRRITRRTLDLESNLKSRGAAPSPTTLRSFGVFRTDNGAQPVLP